MDQRTCAWCGGSMEGKRSNALYCSTRHKKNAGSKRHRERNPGYYSRYLGTLRYVAWMAEHAEERRTYARERARQQWQDPAVREAARNWWAANKDKHRLYQSRRRVVERSNDFVVTDRDVRRMLARFGHRCAYCRSAGPLHLDHVIPIKRGGQHRIGNLLPACRSCNLSKSARFLSDWRLRNARPQPW